ncbi:MAG TPA: ergothioneine biosynthesis protein EgtB [Acidimicrobiales bacterium]|nr:ergothioneine biosynthesis protein EgtB [Acidimicrobiales bacterium]
MADLLTTLDDRTLVERFAVTRRLTEELAAPLSAEDQTVQSMPDVSPTKWHRAHKSWFFETFLLQPSLPGYEIFHPGYAFLFNSYYEGAGPRYPRPDRGLVTRPGIVEIADYRRHVDTAMADLFDRGPDRDAAALVELGVQHEQQHQELLLMDIKHVLSRNPALPAYAPRAPRAPGRSEPATWTRHPGGTVPVGHAGRGFGFDNEFPRHLVHLEPFALADRTVTCGDWLGFMEDGGYRRPELWLADGWATATAGGWEAPLYWSTGDVGWREFTLAGDGPVDPHCPVSHVSYYEADAYARWAGARLPTESEWEVAVERTVAAGGGPGNLLDTSALHPRPVTGAASAPVGDVWQWTSSAYSPYPGFHPAAGTVGEYNGKFMVNQYVLRGGSCLTPPDHARTTYRNFFPPSARWAVTGLRLARNV